jgi:hypothetical protein
MKRLRRWYLLVFWGDSVCRCGALVHEDERVYHAEECPWTT